MGRKSIEEELQTQKILQGLFDTYNEVEHIPTLCKMFSKALIISAENFETTESKDNLKKKKLPNFSKDFKDAHSTQKNICKKWRQAGWPSYMHLM